MLHKLNLGSGDYRKKGYINVDNRRGAKPDVVHDLNEYPYPFKSNQFDVVEMDHVLEHLDNPFRAMKEVHRILKSGGTLVIKVPHFSRGFTHADHRRGFGVFFPYYFNPKFPAGYVGFEYELTKMRLRWFAQPDMKCTVVPKSSVKTGVIAGKIIDFFANLAPFFCTRIWCYWVGGFDEMEIHLLKRSSRTKN